MWWMNPAAKPTAKAVAYYRHSAQDRQENSIPIQREQVQKFAKEHGIEIIREFADAGKSGLSTEGRDAFQEMLDKYVVGCAEEFEYVLVLDVSRWGRFQDIDHSAYYTGLCQEHKKKVIFTSIGFPKEDDLVHYLHLNIERYRAATYSRELSDKVFRGCVKIAEQGFRAGGPPAYGLNRLLLDESKKPVQVLEPGQRKSIQNQRVTLAPGEKSEVAVVRQIFRWFVKGNLQPKDIASALNADEVPSPGGQRWTPTSIRSILSNEQYAGTIVYNKTRQKLQAPTRRNPKDKWVRKPGAFECVVEREVFDSAQQMLEAHAQELQEKYSNDGMIKRLGALRERYGFVTPSLVAAEVTMASPVTYAKHFKSMDMAYQNLYADVLKQVKEAVVAELKTKAEHLEEYEDYIVLDRSFSILIQPSVPEPLGYQEFWAFRPDPRKEVDITLGVPLSNDGEHRILGYLVLPRLLVRNSHIRVFGSSVPKLELYGYSGLDMICDLIEQRSAQ
jgi:DNA invertase Pin-like site-specific DNA recombinase